MTTYRVHAEWDNGDWVVTVPDVPGAISQSTRLDLVAADAAEVIEIQTGQAVNPDDLDIYPIVPGEAGEAAATAARVRAEFERLRDESDEQTRHAVAALSGIGFALRDVGRLVGISFQRAQQIRADLAKDAVKY